MEEIARVYAEALFEVARDKRKLDDIHDQLDAVADAIASNRDLQVFLFSPYFSSSEKREGIGRVVSGADPELMNFLELLAILHDFRQRELLYEQRQRCIGVLRAIRQAARARQRGLGRREFAARCRAHDAHRRSSPLVVGQAKLLRQAFALRDRIVEHQATSACLDPGIFPAAELQPA